MNCNFEKQCWNYQKQCCNKCIYNLSVMRLDHFRFNGYDEAPTEEELYFYLERVSMGDTSDCALRKNCYNYKYKCTQCIYSPPSDYFAFNGKGDEPTIEELLMS